MDGNGAGGFPLPGRAESYWIASTPKSHYPHLSHNIKVDVAVLGAGMVGITAAYFLKEAGLTVAVIEADRILMGVTTHANSKITSQHHLIYRWLISNFGMEKAKLYAESNQSAVEQIASLIRSRNIDCDFEFKPSYLFAEREETVREIQDEVQAARSLGLPASFDERVPLPFRTYGSARFDRQAQFHPRKYLCSLASDIPGDGSFIFEKTRALGFEGGDPVVVKTDRGTVRADNVIQATHYPIESKHEILFQRLYQSSSYVLGVRIEEEFPNGMFISAEKPIRSVRAHPTSEGPLILVVGSDHRTGDGGRISDHYRHLEEWVRTFYTVRSIDYRWTGQDTMPLDNVPYIGRLTPESEHFYYATGFRKWGVTTSVVAAMIFRDGILGKRNPWTIVYDPSRFTPVASAGTALSQAAEMSKVLLGGEILPAVAKPSDLAPGEGSIVEVNGTKAAVYRDSDGVLYILDPDCRHRGCNVTWNDAEKTWDCPCHGSRFSARGEVINSPAVFGLLEMKRIE